MIYRLLFVLAALIGIGAVGAQDIQNPAPRGCVGCVGELVRSSTNETGLAVNALSSPVTITIASPAVVTWGTTIPFLGNAVVNFTTTGALPTGIVAGTNYYVIGASISGDTFQIASSADNAIAGTAITTSGSQSGTQTGIASAILVSSAAANIAAIQLTVGDWDVYASGGFVSGSSTSITDLIVSISSTSATLSNVSGRVHRQSVAATVPSATTANIMPVGPVRFSLSGSQTVYLVQRGTFSADVLSGVGSIRARRM